jgi:hypothetical protein
MKRKKMDGIPDLVVSRVESKSILQKIRFWVYLSLIVACYSAVLITWSFFFKHYITQNDYDKVKWLEASYPRMKGLLRLVTNTTGNSGMVFSNGGLVYNAPSKQWLFYEGEDPVDSIPATMSKVSVGSVDVQGDIVPRLHNTASIGSSTKQWLRIWGSNYETSDIRLKSNVQPCSLSLDFITRLEPIEYQMGESQDVKFGVSAQNLVGLLGDESLYTMVQKDENGYYSVKYTELIAPLINAVKNLSEQVEQLKKECCK